MRSLVPFRAGVCAVLLLTTSGCSSGDEVMEEVPAALIGVWTTSDERYADRAFEITEDQVFFKTSPKEYTMHRIRRVGRADETGRMYYAIEMDGVGGVADEFGFFHVGEAGGGAIFLRNQPGMVWTRTPGIPVPWR